MHREYKGMNKKIQENTRVYKSMQENTRVSKSIQEYTQYARVCKRIQENMVSFRALIFLKMRDVLKCFR